MNERRDQGIWSQLRFYYREIIADKNSRKEAIKIKLRWINLEPLKYLYEIRSELNKNINTVFGRLRTNLLPANHFCRRIYISLFPTHDQLPLYLDNSKRDDIDVVKT